MGAREELLGRVVAAAAADGLADRSLRDIAESVGTSHRMLLYHFDSRAGLVAAIAGAIEQEQREALAALAAAADGPGDLMRRVWTRVSAPDLAPYVRLFFEVLGLALAEHPGTERFRADLVDPWLAVAADAGALVGTPVDPDELRLGIAVQRGLLADLLATGDRAAADRAHERFVQLWEQGARSSR